MQAKTEMIRKEALAQGKQIIEVPMAEPNYKTILIGEFVEARGENALPTNDLV